MFYCEPCRKEREWPESIMGSWGRCEVCGKTANCYDRASSTLPLPKLEAKANEIRGRDIPIGTVHPPEPYLEPARARDRIDDFLALFSEEEKASWRGKENKAPTWVTRGIAYFLGDDPGVQELMRRLKESGD